LTPSERATAVTTSPRVLAVIPSRIGSTRLPRKPLLRETGKYLFQHVYEAVAKAKSLDGVVLATDSEEIADAARECGVQFEMTSADHFCGTDRVAEVASRHADADVVVNIQGDEPEVSPADVDLLVKTLTQAETDAATLAAPCPPDRVHDSATVKVVVDLRGRALYFSRAPIPYPRFPSAMPPGRAHLQHAGLYAFRRETLLTFSKLEPTPLERTEGLEQLRLLENGRSIAVGLLDKAPCGIDTPADYQRFVAAWSRSPARA
jgi:3-deoxy-manno-octulosonate cytidylyltransferase (CMP-KDO synthetase)